MKGGGWGIGIGSGSFAFKRCLGLVEMRLGFSDAEETDT